MGFRSQESEKQGIHRLRELPGNIVNDRRAIIAIDIGIGIDYFKHSMR